MLCPEDVGKTGLKTQINALFSGVSAMPVVELRVDRLQGVRLASLSLVIMAVTAWNI